MKKAFSLTELAVVLLVITLLASLIAKGSDMIQASRIATARALTSTSPVPKVPGLVAWYESTLKESFPSNEQKQKESSKISTWYDVSPSSIVDQKNALTRIANSSVTFEPIGINKLPSIRFDGSGEIDLSNFYQGDLRNKTFFIIFQPHDINGTPHILSTDDTEKAIGITANTIALWGGSKTVSSATGSNAADFNLGKNYVIAAYFNGATSESYDNDTENRTGDAAIAADTIITSRGLAIGGNSSGSYFTGFISEVVVYNRLVTDQERRDVMRYLAQKWEITLE